MTNRIISPVNIEERRGLDLRSGDTVRVCQKILEKGKTRLQAFEGLVLANRHGKEAGATFTVRGEVAGVGVEKIYPIYTPTIKKVTILKEPKRVRRAKLYFLRKLPVKKIKQKLGV